MVTPGTNAPPLDVATLDGERWKLAEQRSENFMMIVFYRGVHCPICRNQLRDLDRRLDEFRSRGVEVIAISGDTRERAEKAKTEWSVENVRIGYGQSVESMRKWGLFVSRAISEKEPAEFGEPGLFLIKPDGTVYYEAVQSTPFARPSFADILAAIDYVLENDYPVRGAA